MQVGLSKNPDMPKVPFIFDYAKSDADRQLFRLVFGWLDLERPIAAPPGTPPDRVEALRAGFDKAMKDPALLADADKVNVGIEPMTGAEIAKFVEDVSQTPCGGDVAGGGAFWDARRSDHHAPRTSLALSGCSHALPPCRRTRKPSSSSTRAGRSA